MYQQQDNSSVATDLYQAIYTFDAENPAELTLQEGDIVRVFNKEGGEWWEGQVADGRTGLFPANRVIEYYETTDSGATVATEPQQYVIPIQQSAGSGPPLPAFPVIQSNPGAKYQARPPQEERKGPPDAAPRPAKGAGQAAVVSTPAGFKAPAKPVPNSKFGLWGSAMGVMSAIVAIPLGIGAMIWGIHDSEKYGLTVVLAGIYSILLGVVITLYEYFFGQGRTSEKFPYRAVGYLAASIFLFFSIPTMFGAILFVFTAMVNFWAAYIGEEYAKPVKREAEVQPSDLPVVPSQLSYWERFTTWLLLQKERSQLGVLVFIVLYTVGNIVLFFVVLAQWVKKNDSFEDVKRLSSWAPVAKAFGNVLDLNCSIIVLPVCRTFIRWLYNTSTANQGCLARSLRAALEFVPLDLNIVFHKLIAKVIVAATFGHIVMHLVNYILKPTSTVNMFGWWPWVSGEIVLVFMLFIYSAAVPGVRHGQFEIFWYNHHFFIGFFLFLLLHGAGGWGPNFWKWFIGPGIVYGIERLLRMYRARQPVVLLSVTHMKPNVFALEFAKEGVLAAPYSEGQYLFLLCPYLSKVQWHPFTISSAPQEKSVTVHIRKQAPGSWTNELATYLSSMGPANAVYYELTRQTATGLVPGKIIGPDGHPLFQIDGAHSAPTQHISEYDHVMVIGAGIGVTPVASTLKSITQHKWKYYMGRCHPDHAYFFWSCSHSEIDSFRWLIRTIKDCEDDVFDMRAKAPKDMSQKRFEFHIYVSSVPKGQQPIDLIVDDEIGFWGTPKQADYLDKVRAPFTESDIYKAMYCPQPHVVMGDLHIWSGRPKWGERFQAVAGAHPSGNIGVHFCGNPAIANDLETMCYKYSSLTDKRYFRFHKENF